jgi:hypothetical protein
VVGWYTNPHAVAVGGHGSSLQYQYGAFSRSLIKLKASEYMKGLCNVP